MTLQNESVASTFKVCRRSISKNNLMAELHEAREGERSTIAEKIWLLLTGAPPLALTKFMY